MKNAQNERLLNQKVKVSEDVFSKVQGLEYRKDFAAEKIDVKEIGLMNKDAKKIKDIVDRLIKINPDKRETLIKISDYLMRTILNMRDIDAWNEHVSGKSKTMNIDKDVLEKNEFVFLKHKMNLLVVNLKSFVAGNLSFEKAFDVDLSSLDKELTEADVLKLGQEVRDRSIEVLDDNFAKISPLTLEGINSFDKYNDEELGINDVFEVNEEKSVYTKSISEKSIQRVNGDYEKLWNLVNNLIDQNPNAEELTKLKNFIENVLNENFSYESFKNTVQIRANDAFNSGLVDTGFVEAQESLYCFYLSGIRVLSRQLEELAKTKNISEALDFEKYFDIDNTNSWVSKTAWHIENNRKEDVPDYDVKTANLGKEKNFAKDKNFETKGKLASSNVEVVSTEHKLKPDLKEDEAKEEAKAEGEAQEGPKAEGEAQEGAKAEAKAEGEAQEGAKAEAKAEGEAQEEAKAEGEAQEEAKTEGEAQEGAKAEGEAQEEAKTEGEAQEEAKTEAQENGKNNFSDENKKKLGTFAEYTDEEIGEKDVFAYDEEKKIQTKNISEKMVEGINKKYIKLLELIDDLIKKFPENENLRKLKEFILGGIEQTKSNEAWHETVKIRANGAVDFGLENADFVSAQEGLYCFHEGSLRIIVRQLRRLNDLNGFEEKDIDTHLNYDEFFDSENKDSWLIKTAWNIENNRKKDIIEPQPPEPPTPPTPEVKRKRIKIIDVSEVVKAYAFREAEKQLNEWLDQPEKGVFDRKTRFGSIMNMVTAPFRHPFKWAKKVWVRQMEPSYRQKFMNEVIARISSDQNLMAELESRILTTSSTISKPINKPAKPFAEQRNSEILESIVSEYFDATVQNLEKGKDLNEPARLEMNARIAQLLRNYLADGWDSKRLKNEVRALINQSKTDGIINNADFVNEQSREREAEGLMYANNLEKVFEGMRDQLKDKLQDPKLNMTPEQKQKYTEHLVSTMDLDISLGLKMADLHNKRPKGNFTWMDRFVAKVQSVPILGRFLSPLLIGAATGLVTRMGIRQGAVVTGGLMTAGMGLASAGAVTMFAPLLAGAAVGSAYAYFRRGHEVKHDRAFDLRREALGDVGGNYRTEKMRTFSLNPMDIDQAMQTVNTRDVNIDRDQVNLAKPNNLAPLAEILARLLVEDQRDEIFYSRNNRSVKGIYTSDQIENITVDLFKTTSKQSETHKSALIRKNALKKALFDYLENDLGLINRHQLGVTTLDVTASAPNLTLLGIRNPGFEDLVKAEMVKLNTDINAKDESFNKFVGRSKLKSAAIGGVSGIVGGMIGQKVVDIAALALFDSPSRVGSLDYLLGERPSAGSGPEYFLNGSPVVLDENGMVSFVSNDGTNLSIKINPDGSIDPSSVPDGWSLENGNLVKRDPGSILVAGISTPITPNSTFSLPDGTQFFTDANGNIDSARLPSGWTLNGNELIQNIPGTVSFAGQLLTPNTLNSVTVRGDVLQLFADSNGNIDQARSVLPPKWRFDGNELVFEDVIRTSQNLTNTADWANYRPELKPYPVSVRSFMVNAEGPSGYVGMDSTPEVFNARASGSELKMSYSIDKESGDVIVDAKRMMGEVASNKSGSRKLPIDSKALEKMIFTLSPDRGSFQPLVFEFNGQNSVRIPHEVAKDFFSTKVDANGDWFIDKDIPGRPGWKGVNGLHGLSYVDSVDSATGTRNVLSLAARWNSPPSGDEIVKNISERFPPTFTDPSQNKFPIGMTPPSEEIIDASMTETPGKLASPAIPTVVAPREQLEESKNEEEEVAVVAPAQGAQEPQGPQRMEGPERGNQ